MNSSRTPSHFVDSSESVCVLLPCGVTCVWAVPLSDRGLAVLMCVSSALGVPSALPPPVVSSPRRGYFGLFIFRPMCVADVGWSVRRWGERGRLGLSLRAPSRPLLSGPPLLLLSPSPPMLVLPVVLHMRFLSLMDRPCLLYHLVLSVFLVSLAVL